MPSISVRGNRRWPPGVTKVGISPWSDQRLKVAGVMPRSRLASPSPSQGELAVAGMGVTRRNYDEIYRSLSISPSTTKVGGRAARVTKTTKTQRSTKGSFVEAECAGHQIW